MTEDVRRDYLRSAVVRSLVELQAKEHRTMGEMADFLLHQFYLEGLVLTEKNGRSDDA